MGGAFFGRARVGGPRIIELIHFEHQLDWRDAAQCVRREGAEAQGDGPTSLPSMYTGLPLIPAATLVRWPLPPRWARITSCLGPHWFL